MIEEKIKKPNGKKCLFCGKPLVGKQTKNCSKSCKVLRSQQKNGVKPPPFVEQVLAKQKRDEKRTVEMQQNPQTIQFRNPTEEIILLKEQLTYWEGVKRDAKEGIYSFATIAAGGIGVASGQTRGEKILNGLAGAFLGKVVDNWRQGSDLKYAEKAIENLKRNIKNLEEAQKLIQTKRIFRRNGNRVQFEPKVTSTIQTADSYRKTVIDTLGFKDAYRYLMGDPAANFYAVLTGESGNGKSTFAVQFANYFQSNHGKVLLMAAEQRGMNKPLQQLLRKYDAKFDIETEPHKWNTEKWIEAANAYQLLIVDSATNLGLAPEQIENIRANAPKTGFLVILQSTKEGNYKGSTEWKHNSDIFLKAEKMSIYQTKSRYSKPAHIELNLD